VTVLAVSKLRPVVELYPAKLHDQVSEELIYVPSASSLPEPLLQQACYCESRSRQKIAGEIPSQNLTVYRFESLWYESMWHVSPLQVVDCVAFAGCGCGMSSRILQIDRFDWNGSASGEDDQGLASAWASVAVPGCGE
jgi:hypothetical protein